MGFRCPHCAMPEVSKEQRRKDMLQNRTTPDRDGGKARDHVAMVDRMQECQQAIFPDSAARPHRDHAADLANTCSRHQLDLFAECVRLIPDPALLRWGVDPPGGKGKG